MKDISLHLLDIAQNSLKADAKKLEIGINTDMESGNTLEIVIRDDGKGIASENIKKVSDPFFTSRSTRKVGLGLPLFKASAERTGGKMVINSTTGKGTEVIATFCIDNIDRPPLGDIGETIACLVMMAPLVELELVLIRGKQYFRFNSFKIRDELMGVPLDNIEVVAWIKEYVNENVNKMFGGVLNEVTG